MPNTPAMVQAGFTAICANQKITDSYKETAMNLFQSCGMAQWLEDETLMDVITAVSGSGPAYVFHFIEALTNAAIEGGMPEDLAQIAARQTVIGAASLAHHAKSTPARTLRENVTSKGGTTQAGLEILMNGDFQEILNQTIKAAKDRSQELAD
jgi:pyrroline-5-carboxylate reductase